MFDSIFYNGEEYKQIWLDGVLVWEKDDGSIVYPYDDCDTYCVYYRSNNTTSPDTTIYFDIIDNSLPYSVNGVRATNATVKGSSYGTTTVFKLVNLIPKISDTSVGSVKKIEQLKIPNLTDLNSLFYKRLPISSDAVLNPQYFKFHPNPTNTSYMFFKDNITQEQIDLLIPYMPNTSSVTDMSYMFASNNPKSGVYTTLDLTNFDTRSCVNMQGMFCNNSTGLVSYKTEITVSDKFNTSNVTDMSYMFQQCKKLTNIQDILSHFDTRNVTNMRNMFYSCSVITSLDLSHFDTRNVTDTYNMFYYCSKLKELDLTSWDTSNITNYSYMFKGVSDCTIYITDKWTLGTSATLGSGSNLTFIKKSIPIESIELVCDLEDTSNVTTQFFTIVPNIAPLSYSLSDLEIIYDEDYISLNDRYTFQLKDGSQGQTLDITYRSKTDNSISKTITFTVSENIGKLYPYPDVDSVITYMNTSSYSSEYTFTIIDSSLPYSINGVATNKLNFPANKETQVKLVNLRPCEGSALFFMTKIEQLRLPNVTDLSSLFSHFCYEENYEYSWSPQYFEFSDNVTNMSYMFNNCYYLTDEMMAQFAPYFPSTQSLTTISSMFGNCKSLTTLNDIVKKIDTSNVDDSMYSMFRGCEALKELDITHFNTENVTSMQNMFENCKSLTTLDLSNFNISKVTSISNMFYYCDSLTYLDLSNWDLSHSPTKSRFLSSGGSKVTLNVSNWKLPTSLSDYFSYSKIEALEGLDTWDTSQVTSMMNMFSGASSLVELDLSNFDFTNNTSISSMFNNCKSLRTLNLSSLDTSKYTSNYMFTNVTDCTIYVGDGKWTWGTGSTLGSGTNLKFVVVDDNGNVVPRPTDLLLDFTQPTMPTQLPIWVDEVAKGSSYYFKHGTYKDDSTVYGLVENTYSTSTYYTYWNCYKVVAPTNTMKITFREYTTSSSSSYPFTIHLTSDATQPSYSSSTNRLISVYGTTYRDTDGIVETEVVAGETYYIHFQHYRYPSSSYGACIRSIEFLPPIESINGFEYDVDLDNVEQQVFTVIPNIKPTNYNTNDLEIIYDSNYMSVNPTTFEIALRNGSQGMSHTVTYRSKADNSISKSFTFYVNADLEIEETTLIDFTQSTAPTLPYYMTVDKNNTYSFSHGLYTTDVYGLIPNNKGKDSSTAYTRYKYVAPMSGELTFTYRCYAETSYDYLTVHVTTTTSQPSTTSTTNRVFTTTGVSSYQNTDGTASVSVVGGTTYYIHVQYYKDGSQASGYDMGCIRKIELV